MFRREASIGQGDPFSPVLFSFYVSFVLYPLERVQRSLPFMYADDLCVIISSKRIGPILRDIQECMRRLGLFFGTLFNIGKSGIVIKGPLHVTDQALVEETRSGELFLGIAACLHIKYLGVVMGDITSDEAFSFHLAQAQRRTSRPASYHLSLKERILLLKTLPTILLTARAYFPTDITIKALKMVNNTALGVDN